MKRRRIFFGSLVAILLSATLFVSVGADLNLGAGDNGRVAYTGGDGVNLRETPGGEVITWLGEGYPVIVQDGLWLDDGGYWYSVSVDLDWGWSSGWILSDYVTADASLSTFVFEGDAAAAEVPIIVNAGGESLGMRAYPWASAEVFAWVPDGAWVEVLAPSVWDDAGGAWSEVRYAGMTGYLASDYLGYKSFGGTPVSSDLWIGGLSIVSGTGGDGVYLRDAVYGAPLAILSEGAVGDVIDGPLYDADAAAWWMVATDYGNGWVHGGYLAATTWAELAAGGAGGSALSNAAMNYVGTPYLWAGVTPNGFDCSGFTYYLMTSILGYDFPRANELQYVSGFAVSISELQPGDLVFFRNTYTWGLSHVGIYIGNGQMVSASGEHMAVGVSNLNDPYWLARYLTARRVL